MGLVHVAGRACASDFGCQVGFALSVPFLPVAGWLTAWFLLRRPVVDRPGVTAVPDAVVAVLLSITGLGFAALSAWPAAVGVGALSFLIGGMLSA
ncbi:hypothetical protein [Saccharothrix stipae]